MAAVFLKAVPRTDDDDMHLHSLCAANGSLSTGYVGAEEVVKRSRRLLMRMKIVGALHQRLDWNKIGGGLQESHEEEERLSSQCGGERSAKAGTSATVGSLEM